MNNEELTYKYIINQILYFKARIISIISISILLLLIYAFIMPRTFQSSATILPSEKGSSSGNLSSFLQSIGNIPMAAGQLGKQNENQLISKVFLSRDVLSRVIDELSLDTLKRFSGFLNTDLINFIADNISIELDKSGILEVSYLNSTSYFSNDYEQKYIALESQIILQSLINNVNQVFVQKNISDSKKSRIYLEKELDRYKKRLDTVSRAMEEFQIKNNILDIEEQVSAIVKQAIEINTELAMLKTKLNLVRMEFDESSTKVRMLRNQVEFLEQQSINLQKGQNIESAFSIPLSNVPSIAREYADIFRDREVLEKVIVYLETQKHQEAIQENKDTPIISVLDEPNIPEKRHSPKISLMIIGGFIIITILVLSLFIFYLYYQVNYKK